MKESVKAATRFRDLLLSRLATHTARGIIYLGKVAQGAAADGVAKVEIAGLRIYPNPASELLIANADGRILGVEVLTLDGRTVARTTTNVVNVSDLAEGAYIAKVYTLSGCESRQIVVKH